ncbi:hypothetical protein IEU95_07085 [Hoyosella rhizosphaerae]|uniref:Uncharacterized protein n=1 Tax=Hoyosella rhizosphaerae TaxID=1755582 RepID=A0A916U2Z1_9ACTN|nr:hypothetical protein [Hoyosella rhizosphaerae]MBN4926586.1 hypothetical protein [Hoyosella rhizosphaerae]GGC58109.1 hypothetical protein GCM10011410_08220 [Hoyosella rhizosphaerae]
MFAVLVLALGALVTATIMSFTSLTGATYWRVSALILWTGVGSLIARAVLGDRSGPVGLTQDYAFLAPMGILLLVVGIVAVFAKVATNAMDAMDRYRRPPTRMRR